MNGTSRNPRPLLALCWSDSTIGTEPLVPAAMSLLLDAYRKNAEAARSEAERATLPNVRARAIEVAARWTEMAERLEWAEEQGRIRLGAVVPRGPNR